MTTFIKSLPYLLIVLISFGLYMYINNLNNENKRLISENKVYCETIKQNKIEINNLKENFDLVNTELTKMREQEQQANEYINNLDVSTIVESKNFIEEINKYQNCLVKQFTNPNIECLVDIK